MSGKQILLRADRVKKACTLNISSYTYQNSVIDTIFSNFGWIGYRQSSLQILLLFLGMVWIGVQLHAFFFSLQALDLVVVAIHQNGRWDKGHKIKLMEQAACSCIPKIMMCYIISPEFIPITKFPQSILSIFNGSTMHFKLAMPLQLLNCGRVPFGRFEMTQTAE